VDVELDPRPALLVGREELLASLATRLASRFAVALCGLGGVGKTAAALEYAYRHLDEYDVVWMFHAEDATGLARQFHELAEVLDPSGALDGSDPVARVYRALARRPARWLLLFDNVPDHAAARRWLPPDGTGHVLITTQDGQWPADQAVQVDTLTGDVGAQLLLSQAGDDDSAAAEAIAEELGGLPLALAQAAGYLTTTGCSLAEYLELLRSTPYRTATFASWQLAFDRLAVSSPASIALLRLLSCLAPEDIPVRLLLAGPGRRPRLPLAVRADVRRLTSALDDAVDGLRRYSLIGTPSPGVVSIHRLVQAVTLDELPARKRKAWRKAAGAMVKAAIPADTTVRDSWPVCAQLLPHALVVLNPCRPPMQRLATGIGESGDYLTACAVRRVINDAFQDVLGAEHRLTLRTRADLAHWTGKAGDAERARDLFMELVPIRERVSGSRHQSTLDARAHLAYWIGEAGDPERARDLFAELLPLYERKVGREHPYALSARSNVAYWAGEAGDAERARDLYAELLPIRERVSGPEHPHTLNARSNLARWTGYAGDLERARDMYAELLPIRERIFGPEHPLTLDLRGNFARWIGFAGDAVRARDMLAQLLTIRERVYGPEHRATLRTRGNLAEWTGEAGDPARAREMFAELVPIYERTLGPDHQETREARDQLAHWTR